MIELEAITKSFGEKMVLKGFNLRVKKNETLALLGPNGCGKTTVLNLIAGLSRPNEGNIFIDGVLVEGKQGERPVHLPPYERGVGYVFQNAALFPNMHVIDNVIYGLKAKRVSKQDALSRARSLLEFVGMSEYANYYPHQISGGQKQRIALARSLATDPQVLLLDEPLSAVDVKLRESLRTEFRSLLRHLNITAVYVTHNLTEALVMSDRVAVMGGGRIEQVGRRDEILDKPNSKYVAEFLGLNVFDAQVIQELSGTIKLAINGVKILAPSLAPDGHSVLVTLKPEDILLSSRGSTDVPNMDNCKCNILKGVVTEITLMKSIARVTVNVGFSLKSELTLNSLSELGLFEGKTVYAQFKVNALNITTCSNT